MTQPDILAALKNADVVVLDIVGDASHPIESADQPTAGTQGADHLPGHYSYESETIYYGAETFTASF